MSGANVGGGKATIGFFAKLNPLWYLVIYIGVTFLFAGIYHYYLPRAFYDQNIKTEIAYGQMGNDAKRMLADELSTIIFDRRKITSLEFMGQTADGNFYTVIAHKDNGFSCDYVRIVDETTIGASCYLGFQPDYSRLGGVIPSTDTLNLFQYQSAQVNITIKVLPAHRELMDPIKLVERPAVSYDLSAITTVEAAASSATSDFVRRKLVEKLESGTEGWFKVRPNTMIALAKLLYSTGQGFPSDLDGNFWRMWYFSCITITTVGFGDIVPITTAARTLVAVEALVGAIIFGLFLFTLVERVK
jgi:hypothetical protein